MSGLSHEIIRHYYVTKYMSHDVYINSIGAPTALKIVELRD